jgi:putative thiamine transport system ATP-binding protein
MGPSGCGKSTLLQFLAGTLGKDMDARGEVYLQERRLSELPSERRGVGVVFQEPLLFPHLKVWENVAYAWRVRGVSKSEQQNRAESALSRLGLQELSERYPEHLSGGEKSRVSILRAWVWEPDWVLMDEPLSALDSNSKDQVVGLVLTLHEVRPVPLVWVTHLEEDHLKLGTRGLRAQVSLQGQRKVTRFDSDSKHG